MAGNSDIIREYLVSLGFKIDQNSLNKFDSALVKTAKSAVSFATVLVGVGTATTKFVEHVASQMEDLYWSSVRVKAGVANIQDFKLALSKVGGTAEGASSAIEGMAKYLRTNPAGEGFLHNLGVATRDVNGEFRSSIDIVKDFAHLSIPYWLKVRFAERFGTDEQTLQAIIRAAPEAESAITKLYKAAGLNADEAAKKSTEFNNKLRDLGAIWDVISVVLETRLLPVVNVFVDLLSTIAGWIIKLDRLTGGLSTDFGLLAVAIWGVNTALRITFGAGIAQLMWKMLGNLALMTVSAFPALAEAIWTVAVAFSEGLIPAIWAAVSAMVVFLATNPIGWAILIGAAIAGAAYLIIKNWDKVKAYFGQFVDWLKGKYNVVAKIFGLPQWADNKTPAEKQHQQDIIDGKYDGKSGPTDPEHKPGMPDFQQREKNLGPNSLYGGGQGANDNFSKDPRVTGKALEFFKKVGWTADQSAGIVANLIHESKLNPNAVGDNGQAKGIAQWHPDRQAAFAKWAGHSIDNSTLDEQLGFVNHELTKGARQFAGKMLMGAQNAADAGMRVSKYYEAPKDVAGEMAKRGRTAASLVDNAKIAPSGGNKGNVVIHQKTDIKVASADPESAGRAVERGQSRVNGDLVRNFAGAVQ